MIDPNAPAYPNSKEKEVQRFGRPDYVQVIEGGLTIRQRYAMAAMQGIWSNPAITQGVPNSMNLRDYAVYHAFMTADAMIAHEQK